MLGAIWMPEWLVDFWTVYGDMITPVLVTLLTTIVTALALKIRTDAKVNYEKSSLQVDLLKNISEKEDNTPQLEAQAKEIERLTKAINGLSEIINIAFSNANIDPEAKAAISAIVNNLKYGSEDECIKALEEEKRVLLEQVEALTKELEAKSVEEVEQETVTRIRR